MAFTFWRRNTPTQATETKGIATAATVSVANLDFVDSDMSIVSNVPILTQSQLSRLYIRNPYINTSVNTISDYIVPVPWCVMQTKSDGRLEKIADGEIPKLLQWINELQTPAEFKRFVVSSLVLYDECFILVEKTIRDYAKLSALSMYPLVPPYVKIVTAADNKTIIGYTYKLPGMADSIALPESSVIHVKGFNSGELSYLRGLSNVNSLSADINIEQYGREKGWKSFKQQSSISGILKTDKELPPEEIERLRKEFKANAESSSKYRTLILQKGMTFESLVDKTSTSSSDKDLMDSAKENHTMVMGVPMTILKGENTDPNIEFTFWNRTLTPILTSIGESLTKFFFVKKAKTLNYSIIFDTSKVPALMIHDLNRARIAVALVNTGIKTPDEARAEYSLPPHKISDEVTPSMFGELPMPVYSNSMTGLGSPSLSVPGVEGGRDQSNTGESQFVDTTGTKNLTTGNFKLPIEDL